MGRQSRRKREDREQPKHQHQHPKTPADKLRWVTRMFVRNGRQSGESTPKIRSDVRESFLDALGAGDEIYSRVVRFDLIEGQDEFMVNRAGVYRMIFDNEAEIDRSDPYQQERWLRIVEDELEESLKIPGGPVR